MTNFKKTNKLAYIKMRNFINKYQCENKKVRHGGKEQNSSIYPAKDLTFI